MLEETVSSPPAEYCLSHLGHGDGDHPGKVARVSFCFISRCILNPLFNEMFWDVCVDLVKVKHGRATYLQVRHCSLPTSPLWP